MKDLQFKLKRFESDIYPAIGEDGQDVINNQINGDYDIFLGIMWGRFGTPTKRSSSGIKEEFELAYKKHKSSPNDTGVMFYFKDAPLIPSEIDAKQLMQVKGFQSEIRRHYGALTGTFNDTYDFERILRINLTQVIKNWGNEIKQNTGVISENIEKKLI